MFSLRESSPPRHPCHLTCYATRFDHNFLQTIINNSNYQLNCISLVALLQLSVLTIGGFTFFVDLQVRNNFLWQKRTLLIKKKLTMGKVSTQKYNPGHSLFVVTPAGLTFKILSSRSENEVVLLMDDHIVYRNNKHNHFPVYLSVIDFFIYNFIDTLSKMGVFTNNRQLICTCGDHTLHCLNNHCQMTFTDHGKAQAGFS